MMIAFCSAPICRTSAHMPPGFHAFVQHTDNFDQAGSEHAIIDNVNGAAHLRLCVLNPHLAEMKASHAGEQLRAVACRGSFRIGRYLPHRARDKCSVLSASL